MSQCHFCDAEAEHEHHVIPDRFGGPDTEDNLYSVCNSCHNKLENMYDSQFYEWFGIEDSEPNRWRYQMCSNPGCKEPVDRLVVVSASLIDKAGSPKAVPNHLQQPFCDECIYELVGYIADRFNHDVEAEVERRTVALTE